MHRQIAFCFVVLVGGVFGLRADDAKPKPADEVKLLEGDWKVVALESNSKRAPAAVLEGMRWSFKGSEVRFADAGEELGDKSSVKLDASQSPKHIDLVALEGATKGMKSEGIYKLEKDRLVICLRDSKAAKKGRPEKFETEKGSELGLITLERVKDKK